MNIWIINGPNLNMLGYRDSDIYGSLTLDDLNNLINLKFPDVDFSFAQSNHEGEIIDWIQYIKLNETSIDGLIINAGGYTHTSIAIADSLELLTIPIIEVHLSDIYKREQFRHQSYIANHATERFWGEGEASYLKAVNYVISRKY